MPLPKKILLLGSGELGKEFAISAKRLGCHIVACDNYPNAPAHQVADEQEVFNMLNALELKNIVAKHTLSGHVYTVFGPPAQYVRITFS